MCLLIRNENKNCDTNIFTKIKNENNHPKFEKLVQVPNDNKFHSHSLFCETHTRRINVEKNMDISKYSFLLKTQRLALLY